MFGARKKVGINPRLLLRVNRRGGIRTSCGGDAGTLDSPPPPTSIAGDARSEEGERACRFDFHGVVTTATLRMALIANCCASPLSAAAKRGNRAEAIDPDIVIVRWASWNGTV